MNQEFLEAKHVHKSFTSGGRTVDAVNDVSFSLSGNESYGIIGESGAGKSALLKCLIGLSPLDSGEVYYGGTLVHSLKGKRLKAFRRRVQLVLQDPYTSLPLSGSVYTILAEPFKIHGLSETRARRKLIESALDSVSLPVSILRRSAGTLSGGQRQRVAIARALVLEPDTLLLDEPVSALDVSVRAQVLNVLLDLAQERGINFVVVSHDLSVIRLLADRVSVMLDGSFVETGTVDDVLSSPSHPYTKKLVSASPSIERSLRSRFQVA